MNKSIIAIIIVAVVLAGGYFLFKGTSQPTPPVPQTSNQQTVPQSSNQQPISQPSTEQAPVTEKNIVTYSESGFSPSVLRVKIGTTVSFKNEESAPMWVASNPHPIHTDYSGFDAKRGYSKGESYSFTFTKLGTWKYHNHLNPGESGTIIVE
ncbi:MAG: hypothetical protein Q8N43_01435 [Candidatus Azambacteria bacterium]|nr:hypothetical protein [Candidatus Azambacteria bacterium]